MIHSNSTKTIKREAEIANEPDSVPASSEPRIPRKAKKQITPIIILTAEIIFLLFAMLTVLSRKDKILSRKTSKKD